MNWKALVIVNVSHQTKNDVHGEFVGYLVGMNNVAQRINSVKYGKSIRIDLLRLILFDSAINGMNCLLPTLYSVVS